MKLKIILVVAFFSLVIALFGIQTVQEITGNTSISSNNNVTANRSLDITYTNNFSKSIWIISTARVQISLTGGSGLFWGSVNGSQSSGKVGIESGLLNDDGTFQMSFIVCPACNYSINSSASNAIVTLWDVREVLI